MGNPCSTFSRNSLLKMETPLVTGTIYICCTLSRSQADFLHLIKQTKKAQNNSGLGWSFVCICCLYSICPFTHFFHTSDFTVKGKKSKAVGQAGFTEQDKKAG